ncbi:MAG: leucine-rich repeat protein, partial [Bacteroidaceae bacterium]|nr:leucine-rich repeat protein [Bacteroidaceae bacterium]
VINGQAAKKMYLTFSKEGTTGNYQAALYEEGSKVYSCYNGSDTFSLLYDFGLNVGEEVAIHNETYTVEMVEECVVKDTPLRVLHLRYDESEESSYQFTWVQGFGGTSEPLYSGPSLPGNNESFQACEMGGEVVLTREQIKENGSGDFTELSVHVAGQPLESLLSAEEQNSVKTLNITGVLADSDYVFIRGNNLNSLEVLNLRDASIDTIPARAFQAWELPTGKMKIIAPFCLKYIGDYAFADRKRINFEMPTITLVITGEFPERGKHATLYCSENLEDRSDDIQWDVDSCNKTISIVLDDANRVSALYSSSGEVLHTIWGTCYDVREGTKVIAGHAFEDCYFLECTLPASLDSIGDYAFHNQLPLFSQLNMTCKALVPPALGESSLDFLQSEITLYVPKESIELYRNAAGWKDAFKDIFPIRDSGIESVERGILQVKRADQSLVFTSPTATRVELYTPDAVKVGEATFAGGEAVLEVPHASAAYLYIVTYPDGHRESGKVMVK